MKKYLTLTLALAMISGLGNFSKAQANTPDVFSEDENESVYVQVQLEKKKSGGMKVGFRKCVKYESRSGCTQIGKKKFYDVEALDHYQEVAKLKLAGIGAVLLTTSFLGSAGFIAATAGGAEPVGAWALLGGEVGLPLVGSLVGFVPVATIGSISHEWNPLYLLDVTTKLTDKLITDRPVSTGNISMYIEELEEILDRAQP